MKLSIALFFAATMIAGAQSIEVPHKLQFADMTLTIRDDAHREIQKDVDALTRYAKSFNVKVERARTFFPLIERIFAEENVPDDFKFLAIQESALVSDAVSVSDAVGYWQFKDFTAIEMGLRVDKEVDERLNIVASTRAAARYIKKNNTFFNNWIFALQAYQMGAGGVLRSENNSKSGEKHMEITGGTYWYVKKYLAHKIAYEGFTRGAPEIQVVAYETRNDNKTLAEIAREVNIDEEQVKLYNKWLKTSRIPGDRTYAVIIPTKGDPSGIKLPESVATASAAPTTVGLHQNSTKSGTVKTAQSRIRVNGIMAIRAEEKETVTSLASRAGVDLSAFIKWNDISISDKVVPGFYYLLGKKRTRGETAYHKVEPGESLWLISQKYGVQIKKLKKYNRVTGDNDIKPGMTLWLTASRPAEASKEDELRQPVEVNESESFAWELTPAAAAIAIPEKQESSTATLPDSIVVIPQPSSANEATPPVDSIRSLPVEGLAMTASSDSVQAPPINKVPEEIMVENPEQHVVQPGETLYALARQYKVGVMDLVNWNSLDLQQGIKPGQVLKLRGAEEIAKNSAPASPTNMIHEVKSTDTVYSIARKYGVTIKELMEWNNKTDFNLSVGEKLRINKK